MKGDAKAGFKLLREIFGLVSLMLLLAKIEVLISGGRSTVLFHQAVSKIGNAYLNMSAPDRKRFERFSR
jgi:hypothetical protein